MVNTSSSKLVQIHVVVKVSFIFYTILIVLGIKCPVFCHVIPRCFLSYNTSTAPVCMSITINQIKG